AWAAIMETATKPSKNGASASVETSASRLAPMPPNALPPSNAPKDKKNRPSANRYTRKKKSPREPSNAEGCSTGTNATAHTAVANNTLGAKRNTHDADGGTRSSLRKSF